MSETQLSADDAKKKQDEMFQKYKFMQYSLEQRKAR